MAAILRCISGNDYRYKRTRVSIVIDFLVENLLKYHWPQLFVAKSELLSIDNLRGVSTNYIPVSSTYVMGKCKEYQSFGCSTHRQIGLDLLSLFCWWNICKIFLKIVHSQKYFYSEMLYWFRCCILLMSWDICI